MSKPKIKPKIGDKVLLKGKFFYPYQYHSCDDCIAIIMHNGYSNEHLWWPFNVKIYVVKVISGMPEPLKQYVSLISIRPNNIKEILTLKYQRQQKLKKIQLFKF